MTHGIVRTDLLAGTDARSGLVSVRYQPGGSFRDIDNGNIVKLVGLENDSRTVYAGTTPSPENGSGISDIVLISSPESDYSDHVYGLNKIYNKSGSICRGYRLHAGDVFSVTIDALNAPKTPKVGDVVELDHGTKLKVVPSATSGATIVGSIFDINTIDNLILYAIKVYPSTDNGGGGSDDVVGTAIVGTSVVG